MFDYPHGMLANLKKRLAEFQEGWIETTKTFNATGKLIRITECKRFSPRAEVAFMSLIRKIENDIFREERKIND